VCCTRNAKCRCVCYTSVMHPFECEMYLQTCGPRTSEPGSIIAKMILPASAKAHIALSRVCSKRLAAKHSALIIWQTSCSTMWRRRTHTKMSEDTTVCFSCVWFVCMEVHEPNQAQQNIVADVPVCFCACTACCAFGNIVHHVICAMQH
jgi:hypothetical protein